MGDLYVELVGGCFGVEQWMCFGQIGDGGGCLYFCILLGSGGINGVWV